MGHSLYEITSRALIVLATLTLAFYVFFGPGG